MIGYAIGKPKDQAVSSALICVLLGPIGWIICAVPSGETRQCPYCAERVKASATVCRYCQRDLGAPPERSAADIALNEQAKKKQVTGVILGLLLLVGALVFVGAAFKYSSQVNQPNRPAAVASPTPTNHEARVEATSTPKTEMIMLTKPVSVQVQYGTVTLPVGTKLEFVSRVGSEVHVRYLNSEQMLPISATDMK